MEPHRSNQGARHRSAPCLKNNVGGLSAPELSNQLVGHHGVAGHHQFRNIAITWPGGIGNNLPTVFHRMIPARND